MTGLKEFWFFFRQNRGAVAGLVLVILFIFAAVLAPLLAPFDPASICWVLMMSGEIF